MKKMYRVLTLLTITALSAVAFSAGPAATAQAQGYSGVFAEDPDAGKTDAKEQPQGYAGVIDGAVPQKAVAQPEKLPQSPNPATAQQPITTAEQLQQQALLQQAAEDAKRQLAGKPETWSNVPPQSRVNGLLPVADSIKQVVDSYMKLVADPKLSQDKRIANGKLVYTRLVSLKEGFQTQKSIPDEIFQQTGAPANYLKEVREGNTQALQILENAINALRQYK